MPEVRNRRAAQRYLVSIPAIMESKGTLLTGVLENISASGALLANPTGSLEVGARGRIRLTNLRETLRTTSAETLNLGAEISRTEIRGYGIRFLGDLDELERLLKRAFGRRAIKPL